jgi:hypothetical protein
VFDLSAWLYRHKWKLKKVSWSLQYCAWVKPRHLEDEKRLLSLWEAMVYLTPGELMQKVCTWTSGHIQYQEIGDHPRAQCLTMKISSRFQIIWKLPLIYFLKIMLLVLCNFNKSFNIFLSFSYATLLINYSTSFS